MDRFRNAYERFKERYKQVERSPSYAKLPEDVIAVATYALFNAQMARSRYHEWIEKNDLLNSIQQGIVPETSYLYGKMSPGDLAETLRETLPAMELRIVDWLAQADKSLGDYYRIKEDVPEAELVSIEKQVQREKKKLLPVYDHQPAWFEGLDNIYRLLFEGTESAGADV